MFTSILRPLKWFYHEFGLVSIHETGRDAYLIVIARTCRMFAYGTNSLILAIFFSALNFSDHRIGLFMTLTLLGDVFLGTFLTLIADRVGRRKVLLGGSFLMIFSGAMFALFENFWILLLAAILGVISVTGGDFGPFRSIEESVLSQLTTASSRPDVLAWYVTTSTLGSSIGSEASGRIIHALRAKEGWTEVDAYHMLFWVYSAMGIVNVLLVLALSERCELEQEESTYARIPQEEREGEDETVVGRGPGLANQAAAAVQITPSLPEKPKSLLARPFAFVTRSLSAISPSTLSVMVKLWILLTLDSLADGMVPYTLTNYFLDLKFQPSTSTLGDIQSLSYFLGAITAVFAGPLAKRIGLINTMVFTHVPSSASVVIFPFPPKFWMSAGLLLVRAGLNNMDQAPRTAFIAAVVKSEERTSVMGITSMLRTLASLGGPTITGWLAGSQKFWIAFVVAGICRLVYDFGLWALFVDTKLYEHEKIKQQVVSRGRDEEDFVEMESLVGSRSGSEIGEEDVVEKIDAGGGTANAGLRIPAGQERLRSRSPHRRMDSEG